MNRSNQESGPLHHAATHALAIGLLGWVALLVWQRGRSDAVETRTPPEAFDNETSPLLRIRINEATAGELGLLPSIGPNMADRILRFRKQRGRFETWSDVEEVPGIGPSTMHSIQPYCELDGGGALDGPEVNAIAGEPAARFSVFARTVSQERHNRGENR